MHGECCYSVYQSVWHEWGVLFFSLFSMDGECCCCAFVISLFVCFTWVRSTTTLYQSVWHKRGVLDVLCLLFLCLLVCVTWDICVCVCVWGGVLLLSICCFCFQSDWHGWGILHPVMCCFCFQSDWHGWGILHLVMRCFCFSVCLTWVGSTTVMLQTSPAPFHAMGNLQRNSAKSMKQFTMPVELSWMQATQVGVVGKGEGKK